MENTVADSLKREYVARQTCWLKLAESEKDELATLFKEVHIPAGETIVTEGEPVDSVFLIVEGTADVRHVTIENHAPHIVSLAKLSVGSAIGLNDTGFYSLSGVRTATVVAVTDMVLLRLSLAQFHGFALAYPHVNEVMRKNAEVVLGEESKL